MGNSESLLLFPYRYNFGNPMVGDFDLSGTNVFKIDDEESAEAAEKFLQDKKVLYVDCEGHYFGGPEQKLGTVQVATSLDCCLVFHITKYRESLDFLKILFESDEVQKVFHDCSGDSAVLFHENQIRLRNVDDTQIAHKVIQARSENVPVDLRTGPSLADLYMHYCGKRIPGNKRFNKNARRTPGENIWIYSPEMLDGMVKYATVDVLALCEIFSKQQGRFRKDSEYKNLIKKQIGRKIKSPDFAEQSTDMKNTKSFNWGLFAMGAVATVVVGAAIIGAAAESADKNRKTVSRQGSEAQKKNEQKKKDECIIS